jgi:signal transduction histidine kinase
VTDAVPTSDTDLIERLFRHTTVGAAPRDELAWLVAHGHLEHRVAGETVSTRSIPVTSMYIVLSGRISIHLVRGTTRHKVAEWRAGDVTGLLPYSRLVAPPGDTVVEEAADLFAVPREQFPAMVRECPELVAILVHVMLDRARFFTSTALHDEKLKSLGKLAAGLAHELNNPAAAIRRFANTLPEALATAAAAARQLGAAQLTPGEMTAVSRIGAECFTTKLRKVRSPLEEAEQEEAIADWLEAHRVDRRAADSIAQSPATLDDLERLAGEVSPAALEPALRWLAADCSVRGLAAEIELAGTRISDLVTAVRGFTQVDVAAVPHPVDIAEGLAQTLAVLRGKARGKSVGIDVSVDPGLPRVRAVAAELNQVWANLIDNALDAVPESGRVTVEAAARQGTVVVRVIDNGPGIPDDIRSRIFDPFFTTKDVGQGTGLGLDIVRRLVERHDGDIEVQSQPGRTQFIVSLPAADGHERE